MTNDLPAEMRAVALDRFGGPEALAVRTLPVPRPGPGQVLVRVEWAGVGEWDPFEREGGYAQMLGITPSFPYVLGSEGSGTVAALGAEVTGLREGDRVYAVGFLNPGGGFYAGYAAVDAATALPVPATLTPEQAAVVAGAGLTALRGLEDVLRVAPGESVLVFGASGGVGHLAVQLAKGMGARVLAAASGEDGVALARRLGADRVVDGRRDDVAAAARELVPEGLDAALLGAGGPAADAALAAVRDGGRVAFPNGVHPEPRARDGVRVQGYNGEPDADVLGRLHRRLEAGPIDVHVSRTFPLERAAEAHRALEGHTVGKLALRVR